MTQGHKGCRWEEPEFKLAAELAEPVLVLWYTRNSSGGGLLDEVEKVSLCSAS